MDKIAVGSDHAGVDYKTKLAEHLELLGYQVVDCGTDCHDSCHYPTYGAEVGRRVVSGECKFGIVVCSTGIGISIAANKINGIRCGIAYDDEVARLMRAHNNCNVIAFGQSRMDYEDCERRLDIFLSSQFEGGRHAIRVGMLTDLENK